MQLAFRRTLQRGIRDAIAAHDPLDGTEVELVETDDWFIYLFGGNPVFAVSKPVITRDHQFWTAFDLTSRKS